MAALFPSIERAVAEDRVVQLLFSAGSFASICFVIIDYQSIRFFGRQIFMNFVQLLSTMSLPLGEGSQRPKFLRKPLKGRPLCFFCKIFRKNFYKWSIFSKKFRRKFCLKIFFDEKNWFFWQCPCLYEWWPLILWNPLRKIFIFSTQTLIPVSFLVPKNSMDKFDDELELLISLGDSTVPRAALILLWLYVRSTNLFLLGSLGFCGCSE